MKKLLSILALVSLVIPAAVFAVPSSIDRIIDHIEPLIKTDYIKGSYFISTSTVASIFPNASTTNLTVSNIFYLPGVSNGCFTILSGIGTSTGVACLTSISTSSINYWTLGNGFLRPATTTDLIGIGTTTPYSSLDILGKGGTMPFRISSSTGASMFEIGQNGNVGIGSSTASAALTVRSASANVLDIASTTGKSFFQITSGGNATMNTTASLYSGNVPLTINRVPNDGGCQMRLVRAEAYWFDFCQDTSANFFIQNASAAKILSTTAAGNFQTFGKLFVNGQAFLLPDAASYMQIYAGNATTSRLAKTDALTDAGIILTTDSTFDSTYSPGLVWNHRTLASLLPKAAIYTYQENLGSGSVNANNCLYTCTNLVFGVSASTTGTTQGITSFPFTIRGNGNIGIGTTTPLSTLVVQGTSTNALGSLLNVASSTGASYLSVANSGSVGVNVASPTALLDMKNIAGKVALNIASSTDSNTLFTVLENGTVGINATPGSSARGLTVAPALTDRSQIFYVYDWAGGAYSTYGLGLGTNTDILRLPSTVYFGDSSFYFQKFLNAGQLHNARMVGYKDFEIRSLNNNTALFYGRDSDGNVGINKTTPDARLWVQGSAGSATSTFSVASSTNTKTFTVESNGNVGIGTSTPNKLLHIFGNQTGGIMQIERQNSATTGILGTQIIKGQSTGDMTDGFGTGQTFMISDTAGVENIIGQVTAERSGADNTGKIALSPYAGGAVYAGVQSDGNTLSTTVGSSTGQTATLSVFGSASKPTLPIVDYASSTGTRYWRLDAKGQVTVSGIAATIATSTGAGAGSTFTSTSTPNAGTLAITTAGTPSGSNAVIATITYPSACPTGSSITLTAADPDAAALATTSSVYVTGNTTAATIRSGTNGLTTATQYIWHYSIDCY